MRIVLLVVLLSVSPFPSLLFVLEDGRSHGFCCGSRGGRGGRGRNSARRFWSWWRGIYRWYVGICMGIGRINDNAVVIVIVVLVVATILFLSVGNFYLVLWIMSFVVVVVVIAVCTGASGSVQIDFVWPIPTKTYGTSNIFGGNWSTLKKKKSNSLHNLVDHHLKDVYYQRSNLFSFVCRFAGVNFTGRNGEWFHKLIEIYVIMLFFRASILICLRFVCFSHENRFLFSFWTWCRQWR